MLTTPVYTPNHKTLDATLRVAALYCHAEKRRNARKKTVQGEVPFKHAPPAAGSPQTTRRLPRLKLRPLADPLWHTVLRFLSLLTASLLTRSRTRRPMASNHAIVISSLFNKESESTSY